MLKCLTTGLGASHSDLDGDSQASSTSQASTTTASTRRSQSAQAGSQIGGASVRRRRTNIELDREKGEQSYLAPS